MEPLRDDSDPVCRDGDGASGVRGVIMDDEGDGGTEPWCSRVTFEA